MSQRFTYTATVLGLLSVSVAASIGIADDDCKAKPDSEKPAVVTDATIAKREAKLEKLLTGCVLVGQFTIDGKAVSPKPERYEIKKVSRIEDTKNLWHIVARIKYGSIDADFPINLPIDWADNQTPVMILDDLKIPLLGTFGGRVMFHGDRYVGTWQHGKVGGHMFGKIERAKADGDGDKPKDGDKNKKND